MKPLYNEQGDLVQWYDRGESLIIPFVPRNPLFLFCRTSLVVTNVFTQPQGAMKMQILSYCYATTPRATSKATSRSRPASTSHGKRSTAYYRMLRIPSSSVSGTSRPAWRPDTGIRETSTIITSPRRVGFGRDGPRSGILHRSITITCLIAVLRMRLALSLANSWD